MKQIEVTEVGRLSSGQVRDSSACLESYHVNTTVGEVPISMNYKNEKSLISRSTNPHTMVQTQWHVLTGAPGAGKSTIINELERRGYRVVHEVARHHLQREHETGRSVKEIVADQLDLQRKIVAELVKIEDQFDHDEIIFFDRALPDAIAYYRVFGLDPSELFPLLVVHRYKSIFLVESPAWEITQTDKLRTENQELSRRIEDSIKSAYEELGYHLTHVPVQAVRQRAQYILNHLIAT
jgi:predicted ATPase